MMITAKEFYSQKKQFAKERKMLEEQIFSALVDDERMDAQGIILPVDNVCPLTIQWLSKYGWMIQNGHIVAGKITDKLSSEPQPQQSQASGGLQDDLGGLQPDDC